MLNDVECPPGIDVVPSRAAVPLTYQQRRRLAAEQSGTGGFVDLSSGNVVANIHVTLIFRGNIQTAWLQRAVEHLIRTHAVLRSSVLTKPGDGVLKVRPYRGVDVECTDLREEEADALVPAVLAQMLRRRFDYAHDVLLRAQIIRLTDSECLLTIVVPHIVADEWSLTLLVREVVAAIRRQRNTQQECAPTAAIQYRDFAVWQRKWLNGSGAAAIRQRFLRTLADATPFYLFGSQNESASWDMDSFPMLINEELARQVAEACIRHKMTATMIILAAFNHALHMVTGHRDITVMTTFAGRSHSQLIDVVGYFSNFCPVRTYVDVSMTGAALLAQTREAFLEAYTRQLVPLGYLEEIAQDAGSVIPANIGLNVRADRLLRVRADSEGNGGDSDWEWDYHSAVPLTQGMRLRFQRDLSLFVNRIAPDSIEAVFLYRSAVVGANVINEIADAFESSLRLCAGDSADVAV